MERPAAVPLEDAFDAFVQDFGGVKVSDLMTNRAQMQLNADYYFPQANVFAELKTLEGIYSGPDGPMQVKQAFIDGGATGADLLDVILRGKQMPEAVQGLIRKRMRRALEQRIKKARKQLRKSKEIFGNSESKALVIVAMDQQPVFGHRTMLNSLAKLMVDNYRDEHTDGVIYLNANTPTQTAPNGMEYAGWYPFYRDDELNRELSEFVNLLGNRWLNYYGELVGEVNPIMELDSAEEMLHVLR